MPTRNERGRLIERSEHAEAVEANASRIDKHYEVYRKRQEIIKHILGTVKRQWSYDHILLKGFTKNNGEFLSFTLFTISADLLTF